MEAGSSSGSAFWLGLLGLVILIVAGSGGIFWARRMARGPAPGPAPGFTLEFSREVLRLIRLTAGRAFVLCTSLRHLEEVQGLV